MRCPSTSTKVASTERPRSATPSAPPAMAPENAWDSVPELSAEMVLITSAMLLSPLFSISLASIVVIGDGDSVLVRRMYEPVTVMVSRVLDDDADAAGGPCGSAAGPAVAAAA